MSLISPSEWSFPKGAATGEARLEAFRRLRDRIHERVMFLLGEGPMAAKTRSMNRDRHKSARQPGVKRAIHKERRAAHLPFSSAAAVAVVVAAWSQMGWATSSGLNNIPTADTAPNWTLVFQGCSLVGAQRSPDHFAAFKFGIDPRGNQEMAQSL